MTPGIEKLKERLQKAEADREKAEAARKKAIRMAQLLSSKLGKQERRDDTRRKIIDGAHMQTEAMRDPAIAALLQKCRERLTKDDDRRLFGLSVLDDAEKLEREGVVAPPRRGRPAKAVNREVAALADTVAELVAGGPAAGVFDSDQARTSEAA